MPATARREIVRDGEVGVYHCWGRCVRRAFLCGDDPPSGRNFDHRRDWLRDVQRQFAALFGVEICFHAEMSNHLHLVLRTRPDVVAQWTDEEVARRDLLINRLVRSDTSEPPREPAESELAVRTADPLRVAAMRARLASISRFMGAVCEHVARRANQEDGCTGRFWEGRFHCRSLEDEAAILVCGMYVDLNPIRAGLAETPEESTHTSARDRIDGLRARLTSREPGEVAAAAAVDGWLCELSLEEGGELSLEEGAAVDLPALNRTAAPGRRASEKGLLPVSLTDYLSLLDWTGRSLAGGKRGAIPAHCAPILARLGINADLWTDLVTRFDRLFGAVVGRAARVAQRAAERGRRWYQGHGACAAAFG